MDGCFGLGALRKGFGKQARKTLVEREKLALLLQISHAPSLKE